MTGNGFFTTVTLRDQGIADTLRRLASAAGDLTPVMADLGAGLALSTDERFERETGPDGTRWTPLAQATILRRLGGARRAFTKKGTLRKPTQRTLALMKILQAAGHLRGSIHHEAASDHVDVGSDRVYARIHQDGGDAGRDRKTTIPARPFLGIDLDDQAMILARLSRHLGGEVR